MPPEDRWPDDRWIEIAVVTGVHGLQGDVRLKVHSGNAKGLKRYKALKLEPMGRPVRIVAISEDAKGVRARLEGFADRTAVEPLRGQKLMIERSALPAPAEDELYLADLIGVAVYTPDGGLVGQVVATPNYGASDLLEIERADGSTVLVPLMPVAVPTVDPDARRIVVEPAFLEA